MQGRGCVRRMSALKDVGRCTAATACAAHAGCTLVESRPHPSYLGVVKGSPALDLMLACVAWLTTIRGLIGL